MDTNKLTTNYNNLTVINSRKSHQLGYETISFFFVLHKVQSKVETTHTSGFHKIFLTDTNINFIHVLHKVKQDNDLNTRLLARLQLAASGFDQQIDALNGNLQCYHCYSNNELPGNEVLRQKTALIFKNINVEKLFT